MTVFSPFQQSQYFPFFPGFSCQHTNNAIIFLISQAYKLLLIPFPLPITSYFLLHFTAKYLKRVVYSSLYQFPIKSTPPRLFLSLLTGEMGSNTATRVNSVHTQARVCPSSRSPLFSHVRVKTRVLGRPFRICPTPPSLLL